LAALAGPVGALRQRWRRAAAARTQIGDGQRVRAGVHEREAADQRWADPRFAGVDRRLLDLEWFRRCGGEQSGDREGGHRESFLDGELGSRRFGEASPRFPEVRGPKLQRSLPPGSCLMLLGSGGGSDAAESGFGAAAVGGACWTAGGSAAGGSGAGVTGSGVGGSTADA